MTPRETRLYIDAQRLARAAVGPDGSNADPLAWWGLVEGIVAIAKRYAGPRREATEDDAALVSR